MTAPTLTTRLDGEPVEQQVAFDMVKRSAKAAPFLVLVCGLIWGLDGAASSGYAVAIVLVNFVLAATLLAWTARISLTLLMTTALFGYLLRLALIFAAVVLVKDAGWVDLVPLGLSLIVTHLGLLVWETRYVSASLAFPGLKPAKTK